MSKQLLPPLCHLQDIFQIEFKQPINRTLFQWLEVNNKTLITVHMTPKLDFCVCKCLKSFHFKIRFQLKQHYVEIEILCNLSIASCWVTLRASHFFLLSFLRQHPLHYVHLCYDVCTHCIDLLVAVHSCCVSAASARLEEPTCIYNMQQLQVAFKKQKRNWGKA